MKRSFVSVFIKACTVTLLFSVFLPTQLFAQVYVCNSDLTMNALGEAPYYINEPVTIQLTLEAQNVNDGAQPTPNDGVLNILSFDYKPDCAEGTTFADCSAGGNSVQIVTPDANIGGSCGANFSTATSDGGLTYVFTPDSPIQLNPFETCTVDFDIMVTGVAPGITDIFETSGWAESQIACEEQDGTPYPPLVASAAASSLVIPMSAQRVAFVVTKDFTDDNTGDAEVHIRCNAGLPLAQDFTLKDGGSVTFTVKDFNAGDMDCDIWEDPIPEGYSVNYLAGDDPDGVADDVTEDDDGCIFEGVQSGTFTCDVSNEPEEVQITVYKQWIGVTGDETFELVADADYTCYDVYTSAQGGSLEDVQGTLSFSGLVSEDYITGIYPAASGASYCDVDEPDVPDFVDADTSDCQDVPVEAGESCTLYNTVFYEGIPTLGQYGKALLVLLMLGAGLITVRRFA